MTRIVLVVASFAVLCAGQAISAPQKTDQAARDGRKAVLDKLKDPDSAKFRNLFTKDAPGGVFLCGEVNAKNAYGGYSGFTRFVSGGSRSNTFIEESNMAFDDMWSKRCQ